MKRYLHLFISINNYIVATIMGCFADAVFYEFLTVLTCFFYKKNFNGLAFIIFSW